MIGSKRAAGITLPANRCTSVPVAGSTVGNYKRIVDHRVAPARVWFAMPPRSSGVGTVTPVAVRRVDLPVFDGEEVEQHCLMIGLPKVPPYVFLALCIPARRAYDRLRAQPRIAANETAIHANRFGRDLVVRLIRPPALWPLETHAVLANAVRSASSWFGG